MPGRYSLNLEREIVQPHDDPRDRVLNGSMSSRQWIAIALCCAMNAIDGYDIIAVTFAMPGIGAEWGTSRTLLGMLFSTGIIGMTGGCLILAPLADRLGRRRMAFAGLILMTASMALSAVATNFSQLMLWRLLTGIGAGSVISVAYPLAAEYANLRNRSITLALMVISYPLGSAVCGMIASQLIALFGWRAAFVTGTLLPPVVMIAALR